MTIFNDAAHRAQFCEAILDHYYHKRSLKMDDGGCRDGDHFTFLGQDDASGPCPSLSKELLERSAWLVETNGGSTAADMAVAFACYVYAGGQRCGFDLARLVQRQDSRNLVFIREAIGAYVGDDAQKDAFIAKYRNYTPVAVAIEKALEDLREEVEKKLQELREAEELLQSRVEGVMEKISDLWSESIDLPAGAVTDAHRDIRELFGKIRRLIGNSALPKLVAEEWADSWKVEDLEEVEEPELEYIRSAPTVEAGMYKYCGGAGPKIMCIVCKQVVPALGSTGSRCHNCHSLHQLAPVKAKED